MNDKWRSTGEFIGLATVVGSLIFVGIQIQQSAEATRSATVLQIKDAWVQTNLAYATSTELNAAYEAAFDQGIDNLPFVQREMVEGMQRTTFHNLANAYYQFRMGALDEEQWIPHYNEVKDFPLYPNLKITWDKWKHFYDEPFQELVDEVFENAAN